MRKNQMKKLAALSIKNNLRKYSKKVSLKTLKIYKNKRYSHITIPLAENKLIKLHFNGMYNFFAKILNCT